MAVIKMKFTILGCAALAGLALALSAPAQAADSCRLKGGDVVPLPAAACAKEGGTVMRQTLEPAAASAPVAAPVTLSGNPKVAAAQQAVLNVLSQTVVNQNDDTDMAPEGVVRQVAFDGCKMKVSEDMQLDYGNLYTSRLHFKILTTVDFSAIDPKEFRVMGEVDSAGGELKAQGVSFLEKSRKHGNHIGIEVFRVKGKVSKRYTLLGMSPYLSAPGLDLWLRDGYGYVPADENGFADKSRIRVLYLVNSKQDAEALKQAFDGMSAACRQ